MSHGKNDRIIQVLCKAGRITVCADKGLVFAPKSNTPNKPLGTKTTKGYLRTCLNWQGQQYYFMLHRIVWIVNYGIPPSDLTIDHKNQNKQDNRLCNLEMITDSENRKRATRDGAYKNNGRKGNVPRDSKGKFGKKKAGRLLDGQEWNEMPKELR